MIDPMHMHAVGMHHMHVHAHEQEALEEVSDSDCTHQPWAQRTPHARQPWARCDPCLAGLR